MLSLALAIVASTATGEMSVATVRDVQLAAMNSEMMPQPAPISSVLAILFGSIALILRMKNSELEFGQRVVDPGRHVDHQAVGVDPLRHRLPAHERFMGVGDIELGRGDKLGNPELAQNGGPRRPDPPLVEVSDTHLTSPSFVGATISRRSGAQSNEAATV